jgi:DNA-binding LacI/PurR family transcriptional regulator
VPAKKLNRPKLQINKRTTQKDVARHAGISQATVSRFYSKKGYVSAEAVRDIEKAAARLNYTVDSLARSLVRGQSDMYALVIGTLTNPFYPVALEHLTQKIRARGKEVLLFNTASEQELDQLLPLILRYRVGGAIILTADLSSRLAIELDKRDVPAVLFNRYNRVGQVHSVTCDNLDAGHEVARAFVEAGLRKIGYLGGVKGTSTNEDRRRGLVEGVAGYKLKPEFVLEHSFTHEWGWAAAAEITTRYPKVEAVFCGDDAIAMGLIDGLRELDPSRANLPFAIVGVDDIPSAQWPSYSLSTVRQPLDEMADRALALLEDRSAKRKINFLPGKLIRRGSF